MHTLAFTISEQIVFNGVVRGMVYGLVAIGINKLAVASSSADAVARIGSPRFSRWRLLKLAKACKIFSQIERRQTRRRFRNLLGR